MHVAIDDRHIHTLTRLWAKILLCTMDMCSFFLHVLYKSVQIKSIESKHHKMGAHSDDSSGKSNLSNSQY